MQISTEVQENYPDIISGITLVDSFVQAETSITAIVAEGLTTTEIDWTLNHYLRVGKIEDGLVIYLTAEMRSILSDESVAALIGKGITIITTE